jgi:D-alanine-D-alanine ligase
MKILIINNPIPAREQFSDQRFAKMVAILGDVGFNARYMRVFTIAELEKALQDEIPDIVYAANYYITDDGGKRISVSSILDEKGLPYIGSDEKVLELVLSKARLKEKWLKEGVLTPPFFRASRENVLETIKDIQSTGEFPYILKPDKEGNSRGLEEDSIVFGQPALQEKLNKLLVTYNEVLVEEYLGDIPGIREFTIGMIGNPGHMFLMPAEIVLKVPKEHRIITTSDKDEHHTQALPVTDPSLRKDLLRFAEKALLTAQVRDYARCDILMVGDQFYAIEINGLPMIPDKWFEICASGVGLSSSQYILAVIMAGLIRNLKNKGSRIRLTGKMIHSLPGYFWKTLCENR